eukprot:jgi/Mesen1/1359/ME000013S00854
MSCSLQHTCTSCRSELDRVWVVVCGCGCGCGYGCGYGDSKLVRVWVRVWVLARARSCRWPGAGGVWGGLEGATEMERGAVAESEGGAGGAGRARGLLGAREAVRRHHQPTAARRPHEVGALDGGPHSVQPPRAPLPGPAGCQGGPREHRGLDSDAELERKARLHAAEPHHLADGRRAGWLHQAPQQLDTCHRPVRWSHGHPRPANSHARSDRELGGAAARALAKIEQAGGTQAQRRCAFTCSCILFMYNIYVAS